MTETNNNGKHYDVQDLLDAHHKYDTGDQNMEADFFDEMWHLMIKAARRGKHQVNHLIDRASLSPCDPVNQGVMKGLLEYMTTQLALLSDGFVCRLYEQHPSACLCAPKTPGCLSVFEVRWNPALL